jgi:regulatory protein
VRARLERLREELSAISVGDPIVGLKPVDDSRVRGTVETRGETGRAKKVSFVIGADAAHRLGIEPGRAWGDDTMDGVIGAVAQEEAMRAAMAAVSRSATSKRRLIDKLCQKGHDRALATAAAERIAELGMIDDAAAADAQARTIARRTPSGKAMIESRLRAAGFDPLVSRAAAADAAADRDPKADALALAQKKARVLGRGLDAMARRRRVEAALARRGFDSEVCRWAARKALGPDSEADSDS